MKTKRFFLALLMCISMGFYFEAGAYLLSIHETDEGSSGGGGILKTFTVTEVEADYQENNQIEVLLLSTDADVAITIVNSANKVVYLKTVDSSQINTLTINVSTFSTGAYKISFKNEKTGKTLSGDFVKN